MFIMLRTGNILFYVEIFIEAKENFIRFRLPKNGAGQIPF